MFQGLGRWLFRFRWYRVLHGAVWAYDRDGCMFMAAALSFYAMCSLVPMTFLGVWALTAVIGSSFQAQHELEMLLRNYFLPNTAHDIILRVQEIARAGVFSVLGTWWSVLAFLWCGISFYESLHSTLSTAWGGQNVLPFFRRKVRTLAAFVVAGVFFTLTLFLTAAVTTIDHVDHSILGFSLHPVWSAMARGLPFLFSISMIFLLYWLLPNAVVSWRLALAAALPIGTLWELGKREFASYVAARGTYANVYGPMAGFILLMVWVYYSSTLILFGAEVAAAWQRETKAKGPAEVG